MSRNNMVVSFRRVYAAVAVSLGSCFPRSEVKAAAGPARYAATSNVMGTAIARKDSSRMISQIILCALWVLMW